MKLSKLWEEALWEEDYPTEKKIILGKIECEFATKR